MRCRGRLSEIIEDLGVGLVCGLSDAATRQRHRQACGIGDGATQGRRAPVIACGVPKELARDLRAVLEPASGGRVGRGAGLMVLVVPPDRILEAFWSEYLADIAVGSSPQSVSDRLSHREVGRAERREVRRRVHAGEVRPSDLRPKGVAEAELQIAAWITRSCTRERPFWIGKNSPAPMPVRSRV